MLNLLACGAGRPSDAAPPEILRESWRAYVARFIQKDGRVIDYRAQGISTSEGQAYAMLRAVWMNDRATFDKTYSWALNNLRAGVRGDHLWAWKWGKDNNGKWHALDRAFATDADQDAAIALVLASVAWKEPRYLGAAQAVLADLWRLATVAVAGQRYLLAGDSLCKGADCRVNPSYYAPYAYRIFRQYDPAHDWDELLASSYFLLEKTSALTVTHLPPDWLQLNAATGELRPGSAKDSAFSYDAFRVFWRVALDDALFQDPRAERYLQHSLDWLIREWKHRGALPAIVSSGGRPGANYESLEMLAGVTPALRTLAPDVASAIERKLQSTYSRGIWADRDSYYLQNWAWFGTALYQRYLTPFEPAIR